MKRFYFMATLMLTLVIGLCGLAAVTVSADDAASEPQTVVLFDGSSIDNFFESGGNPSADVIELTSAAEYVKTGTSSIKWTLNNEQALTTPTVAVHNMVMPVNDDISEYKTLEITYYVSDWTNWSYYGLALHYKEGDGYAAGAHNLPLHNVSEIGWNTIQIDLTSVPAKFMNLYNLFFNINMNVDAHIDLTIVVDRITLSTEEVVETYEKQKNVLNGDTAEGMFESSVNPTADTVTTTTDYNYINTGKSSVLWNINDEQTLIGTTSAHNLVIPVNANMAEYDTIIIKFYISEVPSFEGGFLGFQLHYKEGADYPSAATPVQFDASKVKAGWNTYVADISAVAEQHLNLYNLFFTLNVLDVNIKDIVIAIDDVTFYRTIREAPDYSDLPETVVVVNAETAAFVNEAVDYDTVTKTTDAQYVAEGSTASILWNINSQAPAAGGTYVHNLVMPVGAPTDYTGYEKLTITYYVSNIEAGFAFFGLQLHNTDGAAALPFENVVAGWNTQTFEIVGQNLNLYNIFFSAFLGEGQNRDIVIAVSSVVFNKAPGFNGVIYGGTEAETENWVLTEAGSENDSVSYSTDYAMVNPGSFLWEIHTENYPIIEAANIYVHNIRMFGINQNLKDYNAIELVFYVSDWDSFSFFGLQWADSKCFDGSGNGPAALAIADMYGMSAGWNRVVIDLTLYKKRMNLVDLLWTVNFTPEQHRDLTLAINSVRMLNLENPANIVEDLDNKVVYDGSTLLNCDKIGSDSTELVTDSEYVLTGSSSLKFNITKEATNGHNIVIPVNANVSGYNQLDVTMYVSDWSAYTYFGWQLHHKGNAAQGGLVFHEQFEGVPAGGTWVTFTHDLSIYQELNVLDLYNLFFTINFVAGEEIDMFIVIDNVTFRMVDAPVTGYTVIRDEVAPSISYIKYYNLENEVEVGAEIDLSVIRVTDNKDMNPTLDITVTLNGEAVALTDGKFTATEAGTYVAKLVGRDASGNETTVELKFTAAAAQGGEGSTEGGCFGGIGMGSVLAFAAFAVAGLLKKRA